MNHLAMTWAKRRLQQLERAELRRLAIDLRAKQAELAPLIKAANDRRKTNMRQDGPEGFVMVQP